MVTLGTPTRGAVNNMTFIQDIASSDRQPVRLPPQRRLMSPPTMEPVKQPYRPTHQPLPIIDRYETLRNAKLRPAVKTGWYSKVRAKILKFYIYPVLVIVALIAGSSLTIGQAIIGIYFVLAVIFRKIDSRVSFIMTLVLLICIPLFDLIGQNIFSSYAAIYTFELLLIGLVQSVIELRRDRP